MKALTRPQPAPPHLSNFRGGRNNWREVTLSEIWPSLDLMQEQFCAYCECYLDNKHIEHFRTRNKFPQLTFDWKNLFGSCCGKQRCGTFKDNGAGEYDPAELVKPDIDDPDDYLLFLTTGKVIPAKNIKEKNLRKAEETIRVFNLNGDPVLFGRRRMALKLELENILAISEFKNECTEADWQSLIESEIKTAVKREFGTALRHAWSYNDPYE